MSGQETLITKKRRGPLPTGKGELIGVRLQPSYLEALDGYINSQLPPKPTRPEALRQILAERLLIEVKP